MYKPLELLSELLAEGNGGWQGDPADPATHSKKSAKKKAKSKTKWKPESWQDRQDRAAREATHKDRIQKPAGMDWGTYYKSM